MLENQAPLDIAQLLSCISKIQEENRQLETELQELTTRRDHLVSVNARLSLPAVSSVTMTTAGSVKLNSSASQSSAAISNG